MLPRKHPPPMPMARPDASAEAPAGESKLDEILATRRAKVAELRDAGIEPYPVRFRPTHTLAEVRAAYPTSNRARRPATR
jgi:lysyl-tRNA synthetase class II